MQDAHGSDISPVFNQNTYTAVQRLNYFCSTDSFYLNYRIFCAHKPTFGCSQRGQLIRDHSKALWQPHKKKKERKKIFSITCSNQEQEQMSPCSACLLCSVLLTSLISILPVLPLPPSPALSLPSALAVLQHTDSWGQYQSLLNLVGIDKICCYSSCIGCTNWHFGQKVPKDMLYLCSQCKGQSHSEVPETKAIKNFPDFAEPQHLKFCMSWTTYLYLILYITLF